MGIAENLSESVFSIPRPEPMADYDPMAAMASLRNRVPADLCISGERPGDDEETITLALTRDCMERDKVAPPPTSSNKDAVVTPPTRKSHEWMKKANCKGIDPELFFPGQGASLEIPREICQSCVVTVECKEFALEQGIKNGVWGRTSERERRKLRRQQRVQIGLAASAIAGS